MFFLSRSYRVDFSVISVFFYGRRARAPVASLSEFRKHGEILRDSGLNGRNRSYQMIELQLSTQLPVLKAKRINQLLYCVRLRAMIMPLRYQFLHDVQSFSANPRQPVPQEFQGSTPEQANAFFESLVQEAHLQQKNFVATLERAVEVFNFVRSGNKSCISEAPLGAHGSIVARYYREQE